MTDIDTLVNEYGEENVRKAFWLQEEIKKDGIDGIHFMRVAEEYAEQNGPLHVSKAIRDKFTTSV